VDNIFKPDFNVLLHALSTVNVSESQTVSQKLTSSTDSLSSPVWKQFLIKIINPYTDSVQSDHMSSICTMKGTPKAWSI
jgi:hypothetical protein